ncbi:YfcE family phosphodiesterase [Blastopirellula marina]|uniref:Phosphoesterase n=1 Tax=Blastopirellula marina TaxID=124 RepID=A0A2S8GBA4_9BACT|nr:YfcE family phosphodiesterase [Blastopirellula marina]PQO35444.1 YfcE family phosphodiesterase [Blastopirellula marina]PQO41384.1 YfcE family phosphodiesterase [Blastopirellula marina]PTL44084.1 YfcE family phosphodiesterase [Blastopirellula marina]
MQIGIVSDTHGQVEFTRAAVRMLESFEVEQVIHCGDIGSTAIIDLFAPWPTHYVVGNVDFDHQQLQEAAAAVGHTFHGLFGELSLDDRKIAFLHGHDEARLAATIESGDYDLVCHGHTHKAANYLVGSTRVLNPGALYRASRHTIAIVDLPQLEVNIVPA